MSLIVLVKASSPIFEDSVGIPLPVKAWYPYSIENTYLFWCTYIQQFILGATNVLTHVSIDTLFIGILLKILCQIEILSYRIQNLNKIRRANFENANYIKNIETKNIASIFYNHELINRYARKYINI